MQKFDTGHLDTQETMDHIHGFGLRCGKVNWPQNPANRDRVIEMLVSGSRDTFYKVMERGVHMSPVIRFLSLNGCDHIPDKIRLHFSQGWEEGQNGTS